MSLDDGWMKQAACRNVDSQIFFPEAAKGERLDARAAKTVCREECPVRRTCLAYAIAHKMNYGVWGGMTHYERNRIPKSIRVQVRKQWFNDHPTAHPVVHSMGAHVGTKRRPRKGA